MYKTIPITTALLALAQVVIAADAPDTSTWVKFTSFTYAGKTSITPGAGEYLNPIIAGFYPDPSICRVGDDYYMVNSSFNYFPGIPIWHSKDLVNWTQIGNVIDRSSQFAVRGGQMSSGTYAPTIRYHKGTFYMINTLVGGIGNYYVTATDPRGPWSEPVRVPSVGGIDPDIFFDEDGKCYILSCDDPEGKALYNGHRAIKIQEYDLEQKKFVGDKTVLVNGGTDITKSPIWCEGPHLYKINGTYYLMCAQGGTGTAHTEVIFRSESLRGPYVPWEKNPILAAMDLPVNRSDPVTCTGHADLVQTQSGEWFAVFLACQPYESGFYNTGRQTFMLPVTWENDWPVILPPRTPVPLTVNRPNLLPDKPPAVATTGNISFTDTFNSDTLHYRWIGIRKPASQWYVTSSAAKALFLEPRDDLLSGQGNPSYIGARQQNNDFTCTVTLTAQPRTVSCVAGLAAFQNEGHYYAINVEIDSGRLTEISVEQAGGSRGFRRGGEQSQAKFLAAQALPENITSIYLKIEGAGPRTRLFYKIGSGEFIQLGEDLQSSFLSTETAGGFQGVTLGMFAHI
ncbi:MAG: glycoside hydrolase family 43 protein [Sedimentisphaerales bacterium]|nr:glycoside hydrolase family 43 protein [Sedimentisphaerales bacterium]